VRGEFFYTESGRCLELTAGVVVEADMIRCGGREVKGLLDRRKE